MKTLSERIAERARMKSSLAPRSNRAVVLALRADIQQALDDGWSVLTVHQTLHDEGRVTFSYQAFRRYVNQIHLGKTSPAKPRQRQARKTDFKGGTSPSAEFRFDPSPKKEALL